MYTFLDGTGTLQSAESSVVVGSAQRQVVAIGSVLQALPVSLSGSGNTSISGTTGASIIGTVPVTQSGAWSTSLVGTISGSVVSFQGSTPWVVTGSVQTTGSVVAFQGGVRSGSVEGMQAVGAAVASRPVQIGGKDLDGSVVGGRFARDGDFVTQFHSSVVGLVDNVSNQVAIPIGINDSGFTAMPVMQYNFDGSTWDRVRGDSTNGLLTYGSVYGNVSGSIVSFQGTTPWATTNVGSIISVPVGSTIAVLQSSSIIAINAGSVLTIPGNTSTITVWPAPSIVGTYAEDAAHATGSLGLFSLGVRNDNMTSVTSANVDYSQFTVGPSGEAITANAPLTKWIRGTADLRVVQGASVTAITARGASIFTYVTSAQIANMGSASVLVTFAGGLGSILGYTIAPAGGGSNILYPNALKTGENSAFTASISGTASVLVSVQGFEASI